MSLLVDCVCRALSLPQPRNSEGRDVQVVYDRYVDFWEEEKTADDLIHLSDEHAGADEAAAADAFVPVAAVPVQPVFAPQQPPVARPGRPKASSGKAASVESSQFFGQKKRREETLTASGADDSGSSAPPAMKKPQAAAGFTQCPGCDEKISTTADSCDCVIHAFCGVGDPSEEGFGQKRRARPVRRRTAFPPAGSDDV